MFVNSNSKTILILLTILQEFYSLPLILLFYISKMIRLRNFLQPKKDLKKPRISIDKQRILTRYKQNVEIIESEVDELPKSPSHNSSRKSNFKS